MKLHIDEQSATKLAALEEGCSLTAGSLKPETFNTEVERVRANEEGHEPYIHVFSRLISLSRRQAGLSIEQLAKRADIDVLQLFEIESQTDQAPEPRVVSKLARALELPAGKLMQLVGHVTVIDSQVSGAAYKFAANSGSMERLSRNEKDALNEFVKALSQG